MKVKCPRCQNLTEYSPDNPFRPFCSQRCRDVDFGLWIEGKHAIPGEEAQEEELVDAQKNDRDDDLH